MSAFSETIDHSHKVEGSASVHQGYFEHKGDQKPVYLQELSFNWNGREVQITSWRLDTTDQFSDECVKKAWDELIRGLAYQSGPGISRYLKDEARAKDGLELQVPFVVEDLFTKVLEKLKREMENLYPAAPRSEAVDPIEAAHQAQA
ncbi:MAG: hypothetical protein WC813_00320 [Patescibacteria group bacterium]